jgi:class 3 adenylate cyclase/TolB-like protein
MRRKAARYVGNQQDSICGSESAMVRDPAGPGSAAAAEEGSARKIGDFADRKRLLGHPVERAIRTVLVVDIVESVRLIELDEEGAIARWLSLVNHVEADLLATAEGRLVKCLGDGMLLEFSNVQKAVSVAFAIRHASKRLNFGVAPDRHMLLRMGIEISDVIIDQRDVYGHGVNLASRLASLAGPDEIVVSAQVRDRLTPVLDADVEDLGECYLKHVEAPVRAYRIGPPGPRPAITPGFFLGELRPTLAVIPFTAREGTADHRVLGEVLAEEMIRELSRSRDVNVISRLSTTAFRGRVVTLAEINAHLKADYVFSGIYRVDGQRMTLDAELAEAQSGHVAWADRVHDRLGGILDGEQELIGRLATEIRTAVRSRELQRARSQALPTLKSYTLLMAAITLMHRLSQRDFDEASKLLQTLIERARRQPIPLAWLAKWHVLRVQQGWSADPQHDAQLALQCTKQALDADPDSSLALVIDGLVHTNLLKRFDIAQERYQRAIVASPNDSLAWLLKGTLHAFTDEGKQAVHDTELALKLSPLDPHSYYYDSLAATAHLTAGHYDRALELARRSLRANRSHTSTLRVMTVAQWQLGQRKEARRTAQELLRLEPDLTIGRYLARTPSAPYKVGKQVAHALHQAGIPA